MIYDKYLPEKIAPFPKELLNDFSNSFDLNYHLPLLFYVLNRVSNASIGHDRYAQIFVEELIEIVRKVKHLSNEESIRIIHSFFKILEEYDEHFSVIELSGLYEVSSIRDYDFGSIKLLSIDHYFYCKGKYQKKIFLQISQFDDRKEQYFYFNDICLRLGLSGKKRNTQLGAIRKTFSALVKNGVISYYRYSPKQRRYYYQLNKIYNKSEVNTNKNQYSESEIELVKKAFTADVKSFGEIWD